MKKASLLFSPSVLTVALSLLAAVGDSRADIITWINRSGGNWSKAANWDPNQVPSTNDTALITLATYNIVRLDISVTVSNLTLGGDSGLHELAINGATLTISGLGTIASNGAVNLADGALNGGGLLTVDGTFNWSGGTLALATHVASSGALAISGSGFRDVNVGGRLDNAGSVTWTGSSVILLPPGTVLNNSGTFDIQNDSAFASPSVLPSAAINNTGLFRKLAGSNTTTIPLGIAFNNSGLVDVQSGTLSIGGGGTNSGTFNAASNAVILLNPLNPFAAYTDTNGTFNAESNGVIAFSGGFSGSGSAFTGPGLKRFFGGQLFGRIVAQNLEVAGVLSSNPFEVVGGLGGNCTLTEGPILWTGGGIGGSAIDHVVTIASNVVLFISGTNNLAVGLFSNNGTAYWMSSGVLGLAYVSGFTNAGTLVVRSNLAVKGSDRWFFNSGLFVNESGSNTMIFGSSVQFYNSGTVDVGCGNFTVLGGFRPFTQTAGLLRLAGGNVVGALNIQGGTLSGYGTITGGVINGGAVSPGDPVGTLTVMGTYTQTGELDLDLGGLAPGVDYDQLIVTGGANLRGVLRVALNGGFRPALGENFSVLSFGSRVGKFDCLIGGNLGGGTKLLANYSPTNLVLMTTNGPVQTNTMAIFTCGAHPPHLQFTGLPGQTYSIEATTNIVTVTNCVPDPCQILSRFDHWVTLFRTNSPTGEIDFDDPAAASLDHRFYRARLEP